MEKEEAKQEIVPAEKTQELEIVPERAHAEIDIQVSTAKQYPRSVGRFMAEARDMALKDEDTAASMYYVLPRAGKTIEGPSVRLAEIVANSWGNIRAETKIVDESATHITAQATCWDMQRNVLIRAEVRRRITRKSGQRYDEDMIGVAGNAACSIALRNAIFKVVPFTYVKEIYQDAKRVAAGDAKSLVATRTRAIDFFARYGVTQERVLKALRRDKIEDVTLDDVGSLRGMVQSIQEGHDVDDMFPPADLKAGRVSFARKPAEPPKAEPAPTAPLADPADAAEAEAVREEAAGEAPPAGELERLF